MPPIKDAAPPARKKRGRPSLADQRANNEPQEENPKPRKRGRPSLEKQDDGRETDDLQQQKPQPKKRGRPSLEKRVDDARGNGEPQQEDPRPRKRGRPSLDKQDRSRESGETPQQKPKKKRGRPSLADQRADDPTREDGPQQKPKQKKRGRPSLVPQRDDEENNQPQEEPKPRKRGRPSLQDLEPSKAQNKTAKAAKSKKGDATETTGEEQEKKKRRGRPSATEASLAAANEVEPEAVPDRRRSSQHAEDNDEDAPPSPAKPYVHIAPYVRRVRQATIDAKWAPLQPASLAAASATLYLAHQPILQRMSNTQQRRAHADTALRLVTQRIERKIHRGLPFPPAASEELDFEGVLDGRAAVERQLEPVLHAVELLRKEKDVVQRELERDYEMLKALEGRARAAGRETRALLKRAHVLAPEAKAVKDEDEDDDKIVFGTAGSTTNIFKDIEDEDLRTVATQLGGHAESIRTNLLQTDGVAPQLAKSRAALRAVLFEHLDQGQYEKVVLG